MFKNLYIHFPFCLYKCHYCDFNSYAYANESIPHADYALALKRELEFWRQRFCEKQKLKTIFFGGGTPSLMQPKVVHEILAQIDAIWGLAPDCEITLECNPATIDVQRFHDFKSVGINRISLGVQSFHEKNLTRFGRIHSANAAKSALHAATKVFHNVSCDLIFGFPDNTFQDWQSDLKTALAFDLPHMSCYSLTNEPQTQYRADLKSKKFSELPEEMMAKMQRYTYATMAENKFLAYEISNFAQPGFFSQHNLSYWHYQSYLGLGAGATSQFIEGITAKRHTNFKRPQDYQNAMAKAEDFFTKETVFFPNTLFEFLMMRLRLRAPLSKADLRANWGEAAYQKLAPKFTRLVDKGLLSQTTTHICVTEEGFLFNHQLLAEFFDFLLTSP